MSTATKQRHRPTPTSDLRAQIARLTEENQRLDSTVQILAEQMSTVAEHLFPIAGDPAGDVRRILARRQGLTTRWGVIDDTLGSHSYWGADHRWHLTAGAPSAAVYPYTEQEARRRARLLAGLPPLPGDELDRGYLAAQVVHMEVLAAGQALAAAVPPEVTPAVVPLAEAKPAPVEAGGRHARPAPALAEPSDWSAKEQALADAPPTLAQAEAHHARFQANMAVLRDFAEKHPAQPADPGISVLAPKDMPGFGETTTTVAETVLDTSLASLAEGDEDQELLTALGRSIPATTAPIEAESDVEQTQVVDTRAVAGLDETTVQPALPQSAAAPGPALPPMPSVPPAVGPVPRLHWGVKPVVDLRKHAPATATSPLDCTVATVAVRFAKAGSPQ